MNTPAIQPTGYAALVPPPRVIVGSGYIYEVWARSCRARQLRDGTEVTSAPQDTPEYLAEARRLGYEGDDPAWQLCRDHDLLHLAAHDWLTNGKEVSPVLRAEGFKQQGRPFPHFAEEVAEEEALVAALARWLNTGERWPELVWLQLAGVDLDGAQARLRTLLREGV